MTEAATDRTLLTERAYPDSTNLRSRQSIYDFKEPLDDFFAFVLGLTDWPDGVRVLDVGCGPGNYLQRVRGVGIDLSYGMASEAHEHAPTAVGDVCHLPVATASIDRLLAPHMLYHAPDIDLGASELRRVVAPDGVALIVTNDAAHVRHLVEQLCEVTGTSAPVRFVDRFTLENGLPLLERHFDDVRVEHFEGALVVPMAAPVVAYAESCRSLYETQLPAGMTWDRAMAGFRELVEAEIETTGAWRCETHSGVFVCR